MSALTREAVKYAAASACALLVDFAVLWLLVQCYSWPPVAAATASFSLGIVIVYLLSITLVFGHRRLRGSGVEFLGFAAIGCAGAALNAAVMLIAIKYLGLYYLVAKCVAAGFTFIFNFSARRQLLFAQSSAAPQISRYGIHQ